MRPVSFGVAVATRLQKCDVTDHVGICQDAVPLNDSAGSRRAPRPLHIPRIAVARCIKHRVDLDNGISDIRGFRFGGGNTGALRQ